MNKSNKVTVTSKDMAVSKDTATSKADRVIGEAAVNLTWADSRIADVAMKAGTAVQKTPITKVVAPDRKVVSQLVARARVRKAAKVVAKAKLINTVALRVVTVNLVRMRIQTAAHQAAAFPIKAMI